MALNADENKDFGLIWDTDADLVNVFDLWREAHDQRCAIALRLACC